MSPPAIPIIATARKTTRLLRERLACRRTKLQLVFQSRFGRTEWLKPYAQDTVAGLPGQGVRNLVMIMPGFAADCVETLEEVAIGLAETFRENGGENFSAVPCLNDCDGLHRHAGRHYPQGIGGMDMKGLAIQQHAPMLAASERALD